MMVRLRGSSRRKLKQQIMDCCGFSHCLAVDGGVGVQPADESDGGVIVDGGKKKRTYVGPLIVDQVGRLRGEGKCNFPDGVWQRGIVEVFEEEGW
jgi:hypothetical protein